jgi:hypothetical protein
MTRKRIAGGRCICSVKVFAKVPVKRPVLA